jgi:hypothetical protein
LLPLLAALPTCIQPPSSPSPSSSSGSAWLPLRDGRALAAECKVLADAAETKVLLDATVPLLLALLRPAAHSAAAVALRLAARVRLTPPRGDEGWLSCSCVTAATGALLLLVLVLVRSGHMPGLLLLLPAVSAGLLASGLDALLLRAFADCSASGSNIDSQSRHHHHPALLLLNLGLLPAVLLLLTCCCCCHHRPCLPSS